MFIILKFFFFVLKMLLFFNLMSQSLNLFLFFFLVKCFTFLFCELDNQKKFLKRFYQRIRCLYFSSMAIRLIVSYPKIILNEKAAD